MIIFKDSWFVVTFTGESPESKLVKGWEHALAYIDDQCGYTPGKAGSFFNPCASLHDADNWGLLNGHYQSCDDERHTFYEEIDEAVYLSIVRITEPFNVTIEVSQ